MDADTCWLLPGCGTTLHPLLQPLRNLATQQQRRSWLKVSEGGQDDGKRGVVAIAGPLAGAGAHQQVSLTPGLSVSQSGHESRPRDHVVSVKVIPGVFQPAETLLGSVGRVRIVAAVVRCGRGKAASSRR